jgi:hypothetical protein
MAAKKVSADPLDAMKLVEPEVPPAPSTKPEPAPQAAPPPEPPTLPGPDALGKAPPSFQVQRKITVSWGGTFITLNPGDVVSEASYGPGSVERLRNAGVALEPV